MRHLILIAHNLRSTHNVGSLLRTADGLGVQQVYLTGYTPYPLADKDERLPHLARKIDAQIHKTALDAESSVAWEHQEDIGPVITKLRGQGFIIAGLEQAPQSIDLQAYVVPDKIALIVGREVDGIEAEVLALTDVALEIPMLGSKESFNVVQAAAVALYHCRFTVQ